jgi:hypothetical protein
MGEGNHYKKYEKLGTHLREINGVSGVHFAVWAQMRSGLVQSVILTVGMGAAIPCACAAVPAFGSSSFQA